jgi:hypothetical protein
MLSITFGYSKYYVDSLSENVRRGYRTKIQSGWLPARAPLGYLNEKESKTIIADPDRFCLFNSYGSSCSRGHTPQGVFGKSQRKIGDCVPCSESKVAAIRLH